MNTGASKSNNLGVFYTNIGKNVNKGIDAVNKGFENMNKGLNNITNVVANTPKTITENISSLLPFKANTNTANVKAVNNAVNNVVKNTGSSNMWIAPVLVFIVIAIIFIVVFVKFQDKINAGINNIIQQVRDALKLPSNPPIDASNPPPTTVNDIPVPPQDHVYESSNELKNIMDKVLPQSSPEVFNVNENEYTYYDAEPLCRALGAELATYEQVKEAWSKGADWCNYGWVKGQAAVYPTQNETWQKIQSGPEENKGSCGVPGLNGGYFENPEMKFGVTCYGPKPPQSEHSQEILMKEGKIPMSVPALEVDKKTQEFKSQINSIGVLPFSDDKWSTL